MTKTKLALAVVALILALGARGAAQTNDNALQLAQLMAASGGSKATVFLGRLPSSGLEGVPLPSGTVVGSVASTGGRSQTVIGLRNEIVIYYHARSPQSVVASYEAQLAEAGWKQAQFPPPEGGFTSSTKRESASFCGEGGLSIAVRSLPYETAAFTVTATRVATEAAFSPCGGSFASLAKSMLASMRAPLPPLRAPAGATMQTPFPPFNILGGASTARVNTAAPLGRTFEAFAAQLRKAGWIGGARATGDGIETQSFSYTDKKKQTWNGVLTVTNAGSGAQEAYLTATKASE